MACDGCAERDERIRQLESELYGQFWNSPTELGLTPGEAAILAALVAARPGQIVTRSLLVDATRFAPHAHKDDVDTKMIDTMVCRMRAKMKPFGLIIETIWGVGLKLTPETRFALLNWNNEKAKAA